MLVCPVMSFDLTEGWYMRKQLSQVIFFSSLLWSIGRWLSSKGGDDVKLSSLGDEINLVHVALLRNPVISFQGP